MDEYRPFPSEQPLEPDDAAESGQEQEFTEDTTDQEEDAETSRDSSSHAEHAERQAPNLDHPGGHLTGTVARLNRPRRFGFLKSEDGTEVFFHASALETGPNAFDALRPGQEVEFDCHQDEQGRGLAATLVTVTGEPPEQPARPPRQPRGERAERPERAERQERGGRGNRSGRGGDNWHVAVLREGYENPVTTQLERLLNERNVRPGNFALSFVDQGGVPECWVTYYTGEDKR